MIAFMCKHFFDGCCGTVSMNKYLGEFQIEDLFEIKDVGTTMPVLCRLDNGMDVVAKYMRNPFGSRVLINEFIGSLIADMFKINIPVYGIGILTEEVIANTNYNEDIDSGNAGPCFFTVYHGSTVPASKHLIQKISVEEIERLVLFDHIIANYDRHRGNLLMNASEDSELIVIDHSHVFGRGSELSSMRIREELAEDVILSSAILHANRESYQRLFRCKGYDDHLLLKQAEDFQKLYSESELCRSMESIPEVWTQNAKGDILNDIVELISKRMSLIDDICEMIIDERRKL